jgi:hypothetical protein
MLINLAYLGRGWLGVILRFGAMPKKKAEEPAKAEAEAG